MEKTKDRMKKAIMHAWLFLFVGLMLFSSESLANQDLYQYQYKPNRDLVEFVREAAKEISRNGEAAFAGFRDPESRWHGRGRSLFVYDLKGVSLCNPMFPEVEGKNLYDSIDIYGKKPVSWVTEIVGNPKKPYGWVHYAGPAPKSMFPAWKSAYVMGVKTPSGRILAVGAWIYGARMEKIFVRELVDYAAELVAEKGRDAFPELADVSGRFVFDETSVYVLTMDGKALLDPVFRWRKGRNILEFEDTQGSSVMAGIIGQLKDKDVAWAVHLWPRPGETRPSKQYVYARKIKVGAETFVVCSHMYMENPIWLKY